MLRCTTRWPPPPSCGLLLFLLSSAFRRLRRRMDGCLPSRCDAICSCLCFFLLLGHPVPRWCREPRHPLRLLCLCVASTGGGDNIRGSSSSPPLVVHAQGTETGIHGVSRNLFVCRGGGSPHVSQRHTPAKMCPYASNPSGSTLTRVRVGNVGAFAPGHTCVVGCCSWCRCFCFSRDRPELLCYRYLSLR